MKRRLFLPLMLAFAAGGCGEPSGDSVEGEAVKRGAVGAEEETAVEVHYLGHASFLLTFENGLTVLTDYGESGAYGLDSPVYPLGKTEPDIVTLSHDHLDHSGGALPDGPHLLLRGEALFESQGLTIAPIPTYEGGLDTPDNVSFLFAYEGLKILHLGDCQALMAAPDVEDRVRTLYPDRYDLVLLPIGFIGDILGEAAEFMRFLDAGAVIPMHYWTPADRDAFLGLAEGMTDAEGREYRVRHELGATLRLPRGAEPEAVVAVVGLMPGPPP